MISFDDIRKNKEISTYIKRGNELLGVLGYTDHSSAHSVKVGETSSEILLKLGYTEREGELALIAGYIHDIGNVISRYLHSITGAAMAFTILSKMDMDPNEISTIVAAIGNHDEETGGPVNPISAALILSDKTDVRRSRVRNSDFSTFDIHDRVNYAVEKSQLSINSEKRIILLEIELDKEISSVIDYFEIFLTRMIMCKRAAEFLNATFELTANGTKLI